MAPIKSAFGYKVNLNWSCIKTDETHSIMQLLGVSLFFISSCPIHGRFCGWINLSGVFQIQSIFSGIIDEEELPETTQKIPGKLEIKVAIFSMIPSNK